MAIGFVNDFKLPMLSEELLAKVKSLSAEDKALLREMLSESELSPDQVPAPAPFPLKGSLGQMKDPFEPVCEPLDWDAIREVDPI